MAVKQCTIIGAGLTGAAAAYRLAQHDWNVHVIEAENEVGGNCRLGRMAGLTYEKFGPHIFHTDDEEIADFVQPYLRKYTHVVQTVTKYGKMYWPPQIDQLAKLDCWPQIKEELSRRPAEMPRTLDVSFEQYAICLMGKTLYEIFIKGYTTKQWGRNPYEMSAVFAPKRIDLRGDGYIPLFRDKYQGWLDVPELIDFMLRGSLVTLGEKATAKTVSSHSTFIVTAPLDIFLYQNYQLEWRGNKITHLYRPRILRQNDVAVTNYPTEDLEFIRITEAKHMTGETGPGTVLTIETPADGVMSHPVNDAKGKNRALQKELEEDLKKRFPWSVAAGRLGKYVYIDMHQAIRMGWNAAQQVIKMHEG